MKVKTYLRVGYNKRNRKHTIVANVKPNNTPLYHGNGDAMPTLSFGIVLDIPDAAFAQAERIIATLTIPESAVTIAAEVEQHGEG